MGSTIIPARTLIAAGLARLEKLMRTGLLTVAALLLLMGCGLAAITLTDATSRGLAMACGVATSFVLGIGVGERSKAAYCRELLRINKHLGELNEALCESNLAMMQTGRKEVTADPDAPV